MRLLRRIASFLKKGSKVDEALFNELEERLIEADVGLAATHKLLEKIDLACREGRCQNSTQIIDLLKEALLEILGRMESTEVDARPEVIMAVGVNGTGKTTSIAKLAHHYNKNGKKVMLVCCDTYRAAAGEQLATWARRLNVDSVIGESGADPASVAFDALDAAVARSCDLLIVDTAGRQHTRGPLMEELAKVKRVIGTRLAGAPHRVLLVLDATTGQNAISQARIFTEQIGVTGIVLTKLDGTAKGGILIAIADQFRLPIDWIGLGEEVDQIRGFSPSEFVDSIFEDGGQ
jgi:fused signal recognition particle receptor